MRAYDRTGRLRSIRDSNGNRLFDPDEVDRLAAELAAEEAQRVAQVAP